MVFHRIINLAAGLMVLATVACTDSKFGSQQPASQPAKPASTSDQAPVPEPTASASSPVAEKKCTLDQAQFKAALSDTSPIRKCMDSQKLYNFEKWDGTCVDLAPIEKCDFKSFNSLVEARGMSAASVMAEYPNAVMVGCGQKRDGKTLLGQWWIPDGAIDQEKCEMNVDYTILTACFEVDDFGRARPEPKTEAEKQAAVLACMQK